MAEVVSYGVIAWKYIGFIPHVLVVKPPFTYEFGDLLKGRYVPNDTPRITSMIEGMTIDEQIEVSWSNYSYLWRRLTRGRRDKPEGGRKRFKALKSSQLFTDLMKAGKFRRSISWDFPKGRREREELEEQTAFREFSEETGYKDLIKFPMEPLTYHFVGSDAVKYSYKYFFAYCNDDSEPAVDITNRRQVCEIVDIKWAAIEDLEDLMPDKKALISALGDRYMEVTTYIGDYLAKRHLEAALAQYFVVVEPTNVNGRTT